MSNKNKILIILIILIVVLIFIFLFRINSTSNSNNNNNSKTNNTKILEKSNIDFQKNDEYEIKDSLLINTESSSEILLTIKNVSNHNLEERNLKIVVKDENQKMIFESFIDGIAPMEINSERKLQLTTTSKLSADKKYNYYIEVVNDDENNT